MAAPRKYPQELRDRAIRLARESDRPLAHIAKDLGVHPEALRNWVLCRPRHKTHYADLRVMPTW
jgi:transposase-like protein